MRFQDLEEAQGLTLEMVWAWLLANGWALGPAKQQGDYLPPGKFFTKGSASLWNGAVMEQFDVIAEAEHRSPQSLLRDLNPRMRKGVPDQASIDAHRGLWIGHMGGMFPFICIGIWFDSAFVSGALSWNKGKIDKAAKAEYPCAFWPCDAHGNKCAWPPARDGEG